MDDIFLEQAEIQNLTNRARRHAQAKVLRAMGVEHKVRPDGSVVVLRAHIHKVFDGEPDSPRHRTKVAGPNWAALGRT